MNILGHGIPSMVQGYRHTPSCYMWTHSCTWHDAVVVLQAIGVVAMPLGKHGDVVKNLWTVPE